MAWRRGEASVGEPAAKQPDGKRELLVSRTWLQVAGLVILAGFFVLVLLAYRTYQSDPPIPDRAVDPSGSTVYTGDDIRAGQKVFLHHGLMEYGSIFGHGAYLGPDFTADYLHRSSGSVRDQLGGERSDSARAGDDQPVPDQPLRPRHEDDPALGPAGAGVRRARTATTRTSSTARRHVTACGPRPINDPEQIRQLTAFFAWTSWAASARRPGHNYSYTNNWPPEEQVGNTPSADVLVWSVISLIALLGGIGILFAAFGRWRLGWQGREQATLSFRSPGDVALTPAQRATAWFFFVMAALFLLQTLVGCRLAALPGRARRLLRHRHRPGVPLQPGPHLARAAGDLLRLHLVRRRRHLPRADDRRPRAARPEQARVRSARSAGGRGLRQPDRRVRRHPQLVLRARSSATRASSTSTWGASGRCC